MWCTILTNGNTNKKNHQPMNDKKIIIYVEIKETF